jgi:adenylate cyclase
MVALVVFLVLLPIMQKPPAVYQDLDQLAFDFVVDHGSLTDSSQQVVLVDFDEDTFQNYKQFPLPRTLFSDVINKVAVGKPRVIGLDVLLSEKRDPADDQAMQDALTNANVVVLADQAPAGNLPAALPLPRFCQPDTPPDPNFCADGKPGAMAHAFINMPNDPDGFVRQANLFYGSEESFPLLLAQQYSGQAIVLDKSKKFATFLGHKIPFYDANHMTFLIGSWGKEPATRIPAWKVIAGQIPPSAFTEKLVLIGQSSNASGDVHLTPLFRKADKGDVRLKLGGTAVHAAAIRTLLEGKSVKLATVGVLWAVILIMATASAILLLNCDLSLGLGGLVALMAIAFGISDLLFAKLRFWMPFLPVEAGLALTLPITLGLRYAEERLLSKEAGLQREQMMKLFSSYVDPAVAETIWQRRDELFLEGEERTATVMFTDIRSFTAMSLGQPPAVVLGWLNRYVSAMDEVIREHGGFLNKFIGDGLMIIFGLPIGKGVAEDAKRAVEAGLAMLARVESLNAEAKDHPEFPALRIGIGIHTGHLMAGSIGSANRQEYSVIGETVNLASRLESLNKPYHTELIMSAATMRLVADSFPGLESLGGAKVPGIHEPVEIYTLRLVANQTQELTEAGAIRS